ncbi:ABC-type multidrug transport system, ATPase and permease component [Austwickia chelonae]|uniref:Putative ABC transporter protein n=1 Tax=Austwickia chelonae NBRC 105200 TaxID=1184607 RepID=K6VK38_9MICO|nr:ABC transporter ATP-binding protein [Austwickia chelonae]GAB77069.1 putative ABC transporter protein [Austwickia chelonae NBRC 105200]SEW33781.1 ABC-type multidrug transport system, ATPase and permease component [Austwickia chelonae]
MTSSSPVSPVVSEAVGVRRDPLWALLPWLHPERRALGWTLAVDVLARLLLVGQSVVLTWAVAEAVVHRVLPPWWLWLVGAALIVSRMVLTWHEMDISHDVAYRVLAHLRAALFGGFSRGVPRRAPGQHTGRLASTAMGDVETLEFFYAHTVPQLASAGLLLVGGTVVAAVVSPSLSVVLPSAAVALVVAGLVGARRARVLGERALVAKESLAAVTVDVFGAAREVIAHQVVGRCVEDVVAAGRRADRARARVEVHQQRQDQVREVVVLAAVLVVLVVSSRSALSGPVASAVTVGALALLGPVAEAATTVTRLQPLRAAAGRVVEGISLPVEGLSEPVSPVAVGEGPWGLSVEGVRVDFPQETVSVPTVVVRPGERVALVGPSGCGKSTVVNVLSGVWVPDAGSVSLWTVGGGRVALGELPSEVRCRRIAVVDQESTVVHGTVRDNVRLGRPGASEELVLASLERAGLVLEGPRWVAGLDTVVGEGGLSLSGGQRARLALARAWAQEPSVLVLDETTSGLDARTEADVLSRLCSSGRGTTVVVVSHRESTVAAMDRVIRLG